MQLSAKSRIVVILLLPPFVKLANSCFKPRNFFAVISRCSLRLFALSDKLQDCNYKKHGESSGGDN